MINHNWLKYIELFVGVLNLTAIYVYIKGFISIHNFNQKLKVCSSLMTISIKLKKYLKYDNIKNKLYISIQKI